MPSDDARRWNARYSEQGGRYARFTRPRPFLLHCASHLPASGLALDVAMGLGGNAGFLLSRGLRVIGVDISITALRQARARHPGLMAYLADLSEFYTLPAETFDVILNFYYLQRELWPQYERALRPGGLLIIETLTQEMLARLPETDPAYLLAPGELKAAFPGLETLEYAEGWTVSDSGHARASACLAEGWTVSDSGHARASACLAARKPLR